MPRLRDAKASAILEARLKGERFRSAQIERYVRRQRLEPAAVIRVFFRAVGRDYGRLTALLGSRIVLRIVLSVSRRTLR